MKGFMNDLRHPDFHAFAITSPLPPLEDKDITPPYQIFDLFPPGYLEFAGIRDDYDDLDEGGNEGNEGNRGNGAKGDKGSVD
jgi:hypothetical protein